MWGRVCDEDDHFAGRGAPVEVEGVPEGGGDRLGAVAAAAGIEGLEVVVDLGDVRCEAKVAGDVGVVLGGVVAKGDEGDAEVVWVGETAVGDDVSTDALDVLRRVCDVGALRAGGVLDKDEVAGGNERGGEETGDSQHFAFNVHRGGQVG